MQPQETPADKKTLITSNHTHTLLFPLFFGEQKIEQITLRRAKVADLAAAKDAETHHDQSMILLTRLGSLSPEQVAEMDAADWAAMNEVITGFLLPPQASKIS